jgi:hypothetical protein
MTRLAVLEASWFTFIGKGAMKERKDTLINFFRKNRFSHIECSEGINRNRTRRPLVKLSFMSVEFCSFSILVPSLYSSYLQRQVLQRAETGELNSADTKVVHPLLEW